MLDVAEVAFGANCQDDSQKAHNPEKSLFPGCVTHVRGMFQHDNLGCLGHQSNDVFNFVYTSNITLISNHKNEMTLVSTHCQNCHYVENTVGSSNEPQVTVSLCKNATTKVV